MTRFPTIEPEQYSAEQQRVVDTIVTGPRAALRGPFPALLHVPALADAVQNLGTYLRFQVSLAPALKEFTILITGRFWQAQYEWYAHSALALAAGLDPAIVEQLARGEHPKGMSEEQEAIYAFCTELHLNHEVSDATFARAEARFGRRGVLELIGISGYYTLVSMVLNTAGVALPEDGVALPTIDSLKP
jgi:4-carboxymuconolactone decarboxylase